MQDRIIIYGRLLYAGLDAEGNIHIVISKTQKTSAEIIVKGLNGLYIDKDIRASIAGYRRSKK